MMAELHYYELFPIVVSWNLIAFADTGPTIFRPLAECLLVERDRKTLTTVLSYQPSLILVLTIASNLTAEFVPPTLIGSFAVWGMRFGEVRCFFHHICHFYCQPISLSRVVVSNLNK